MFAEERDTWAVAAQHPWLDEGSGDADVVEQTAVLTAGLQPRTCDQHLHTSLQHTKRPLIPHAAASVSIKVLLPIAITSKYYQIMTYSCHLEAVFILVFINTFQGKLWCSHHNIDV